MSLSDEFDEAPFSNTSKVLSSEIVCVDQDDSSLRLLSQLIIQDSYQSSSPLMMMSYRGLSHFAVLAATGSEWDVDFRQRTQD